jgi:hypothetical protein
VHYTRVSGLLSLFLKIWPGLCTIALEATLNVIDRSCFAVGESVQRGVFKGIQTVIKGLAEQGSARVGALQ